MATWWTQRGRLPASENNAHDAEFKDQNKVEHEKNTQTRTFSSKCWSWTKTAWKSDPDQEVSGATPQIWDQHVVFLTSALCLRLVLGGNVSDVWLKVLLDDKRSDYMKIADVLLLLCIYSNYSQCDQHLWEWTEKSNLKKWQGLVMTSSRIASHLCSGDAMGSVSLWLHNH